MIFNSFHRSSILAGATEDVQKNEFAQAVGAEGKVKWGEYGDHKVWKLSSQSAQQPTCCEDLGKSGFFLSQSVMMQVKVLHELCTIKIHACISDSEKRESDRDILTDIVNLSS